MKTKLILLIFVIGFFYACNQKNKQAEQVISQSDNSLVGKWVKVGQTGPVCFDFKNNGLFEGDFGNDQTVDVVAKYELSGDTLKLIDKEGQMCQGVGKYLVYQSKYYISIDLIDDECGGRVKTTMGFWTKPNFKDFIKTLDEEIEKSPNPDLYLSRARVHLATGMIKKAKDDFDKYLLNDTLDARVFINRAGTRFPNDLEGVVSDCNKAIALDANSKNAYFLRGLARYELGEEEQGCKDFSKAIELGFSVLRIAEQERCAEFWDEK